MTELDVKAQEQLTCVMHNDNGAHIPNCVKREDRAHRITRPAARIPDHSSFADAETKKLLWNHSWITA